MEISFFKHVGYKFLTVAQRDGKVKDKFKCPKLMNEEFFFQFMICNVNYWHKPRICIPRINKNSFITRLNVLIYLIEEYTLKKVSGTGIYKEEYTLRKR